MECLCVPLPARSLRWCGATHATLTASCLTAGVPPVLRLLRLQRRGLHRLRLPETALPLTTGRRVLRGQEAGGSIGGSGASRRRQARRAPSAEQVDGTAGQADSACRAAAGLAGQAAAVVEFEQASVPGKALIDNVIGRSLIRDSSWLSSLVASRQRADAQARGAGGWQGKRDRSRMCWGC